MFPYQELYHYTEKFTRDPDLRQDLVLLAWKESGKAAKNSDIRLLKNYIKLRSKEIHTRSPLGVDISGKSLIDAWNHDRVSITKPVGRRGFTLESTLAQYSTNPFGMCVVNTFEESLTDVERHVAEQMVAGYTQREAVARLGISQKMFADVRHAVREKALEYLI
jgi:hypothetical protein